MSRIYTILGALAVVGALTGASYMKGRYDGKLAQAIAVAEDTRELNTRIDDLQEKLKASEALRLQEVAELDVLVDQLEREANESVNANRPAIDIDGVRRLNRITSRH